MAVSAFWASKQKPYFIAEVGVNHECNIALAELQIRQAARAGASAVKFQAYKAERLAHPDSPAYWDESKETTNSQFTLFKRYDHFSIEQYVCLASICAESGVEFLCTPFDVDFVDELNPIVNFFKVASADITNLPLLKRIAETNKPVLLSTGASNVAEIRAAVEFLGEYGVVDLCLMHCVLNYPTSKTNASLGAIIALQREFPEIVIGYSDHTEPEEGSWDVLSTAFSLGAYVIEKHFTHDRSLPGNDHYHAIDEEGLSELMIKLRTLSDLIGPYEKLILPSEQKSRLNARRGLYYSSDLASGHLLTESDLQVLRPVKGLGAERFYDCIGKRLTVNVEAGQSLTISDFE